MSETSRRRRWLGRTLVGAGALALPLTASISYAAAQDAPEPPVAPVAPTAPYPPEAPTAPEGVAPIEHRTYVVRREGPDGQPIVRRFAFNVPPGAPNPPRPPQLNGDPDSPEFEREMERFEREMERFEAEVEAHEDEWERLGEEAAELGEAHRVQALALADHALRVAPEVVESCDGDGNVMVRNTPGANGRQRIVICQQAIQRTASRGVRRARESIANNPEIREEVRREVLEELDSEIERIEREED